MPVTARAGWQNSSSGCSPGGVVDPDVRAWRRPAVSGERDSADPYWHLDGDGGGLRLRRAPPGRPASPQQRHAGHRGGDPDDQDDDCHLRSLPGELPAGSG